MAKSDFVAAPRSAQRRASRSLFALIVLVALVTGLPDSVRAMSVKDYLDLNASQQSDYSIGFIAKMTADIGRTNPDIMREIRDWFVKVPPGGHFPEGTTRFNLELLALDDLAKEGKIDLSKIQVEGVIVKVIEEKFPPPNGGATP